MSGHTHEHRAGHDAFETPREFWEQRYSQSEQIWSGRPNFSLTRAIERHALTPGRSLDLGCGEGGDVIWLAQQGWQATGIDLSATAISRARQAAATLELSPASAAFIEADLAEWVARPAETDGSMSGFDLVSASFLQSPVELAREHILRAVANRVAPGGCLIIITHGSVPPWANDEDARHAHLPGPQEELEALALDETTWAVLEAQAQPRQVAAPDGSPAEILDTVVVARRLPVAG